MMNGRQRCGQGIVSHESGRTTRKKSAKVAVGKSNGEEAYGAVPRVDPSDSRTLLHGRLGVVLGRDGRKSRDGRDRIVAARVEQGVLDRGGEPRRVGAGRLTWPRGVDGDRGLSLG